jgi:hypothetical protein
MHTRPKGQPALVYLNRYGLNQYSAVQVNQGRGSGNLSGLWSADWNSRVLNH